MSLPLTTNLLAAVDPLHKGGLAVIPTDTIYGLVCRAADPTAVERLYAARQRNPANPCIILISDQTQLADFQIALNPTIQAKLADYWPGPTSVVLPCPVDELTYLHRGRRSLAFRLPDDSALRALIRQTGSLLAPSANPESRPPATTIAQAQAYFGLDVAIYVDAGTRVGQPSRLISLDAQENETVLRP